MGYEGLPISCYRCGKLGHLDRLCLKLSKDEEVKKVDVVVEKEPKECKKPVVEKEHERVLAVIPPSPSDHGSIQPLINKKNDLALEPNQCPNSSSNTSEKDVYGKLQGATLVNDSLKDIAGESNPMVGGAPLVPPYQDSLHLEAINAGGRDSTEKNIE